MKAIFALEPATPDLIREMSPVMLQNTSDIPVFPEFKLRPNFEIYLQMQELGVLRIYTIREGETLVGYQVFTVSQHQHFLDMKQAHSDFMFVVPEARKGSTGIRFLKWGIDQLKTEGVQVVYQNVNLKYNGERFGKLLMRMGFEPIDKIYARRL